jgi:hypothetical protein
VAIGLSYAAAFRKAVVPAALTGAFAGALSITTEYLFFVLTGKGPMMFAAGLSPGLVLIAAVAGFIVAGPVALFAGAIGLRVATQDRRFRNGFVWASVGVACGAVLGAAYSIVQSTDLGGSFELIAPSGILGAFAAVFFWLIARVRFLQSNIELLN